MNLLYVRQSAGVLCTMVAAIVVAALVVEVGGKPAEAARVSRQDDLAAHATATRSAELAEITALREKVAALETQTAENCAEPSPTPEPTQVPAVPSGQPTTYAGDWTVIVEGATPRPSVDDLVAEGTFIEVVLSVTHGGAAPRTFPLFDLALRDAQGRVFLLDLTATTRLDALAGLSIDPQFPHQVRAVFDVAADAGQSFVLESVTDPTFRIEVGIQARG